MHQHLSGDAGEYQHPDHSPYARAVRLRSRAFRPYQVGLEWRSLRSRSVRRVIEKHFTLSRADGGVDALFPGTRGNEVTGCRNRTGLAGYGGGELRANGKRAEVDGFRRSLYVVEDVRAGELLTENKCGQSGRGMGWPLSSCGMFWASVVTKTSKEGRRCPGRFWGDDGAAPFPGPESECCEHAQVSGCGRRGGVAWPQESFHIISQPLGEGLEERLFFGHQKQFVIGMQRAVREIQASKCHAAGRL